MHRLQITYEQLLETIQEGIWVIDADSNTTFVNPKMAEILGYVVEEMIGKNLFSFMDEEEIQNAERRVEDRKSGLAENHESKMKHKDGHDVYVELKTTPVTDDGGNYKGAVAGVTDITDRKEMEDQVKIYQDITNNMQVGLHVYHLEDPDDNTTLRMVATNPAAVMHTGLTEEEVLGKTLEESFPNLRRTNHPQRYAEVARSGKALEIEDTYYSDDKIVNASFAVKVFPLPKNCVGVIFENITKRKQAEEALKSSEQELRTITDNMTDVVVMADVEGRFTYLSESGYHLCGYKPSELLGKNIFDLIHEDDLTSAGAIFQEGVVEDRKDARIEYRVRHKNGDYIWVESIGNLVFDDNGQPSGVLFVSRDITDRKKIEEALKLQASERAAVDAFTNSVSHDLQAPLRRIEGFSEALLEECPDELSKLARDYLQRITRQIGSMKERTDALLKLSRIVSHNITREEVNLSALARAYLKRRCTVEPERQIETAIAPDLVASGDAHLLSIVIENLLHNAWKYTAETEKARIECGSILKDGLTIYFVKDNGAGFDQQRADEIFDPFKKLHSETEYPGIGIGLNLVYRIITRHGGKIWAEGEPGKGACFFFTL